MNMVDNLDFVKLKVSIKDNYDLIHNARSLTKPERDVLALLVVYKLKKTLDGLIKKWRIEDES